MIKGILFDKDGTLFDFNATWGAWTRRMLADEVGDDPERLDRLAKVMGFDTANERFFPGSVVIAATVHETAEAMLTVLTDTDKETLVARMRTAATKVIQKEATPLRPYFDDLRLDGLRLGIATNDAEVSALAHLERAGIRDHFDFIAGYDSGHGAKPGQGQMHGFCAHTGLTPDQCIMVGDSLHDLEAGRAAGMMTIGVLTGPAPAEELAPKADQVLPTIADIPDWLRSQNLV
ncbi:HAD family hydrolase [Yoonia sp. 2307UL14-13]|uniref:HAD family hydrolase n=1 Tax=Yoonia sp. 2307UL14-13 TaxID=3126506 RepID=UPI0030AAC392